MANDGGVNTEMTSPEQPQPAMGGPQPAMGMEPPQKGLMGGKQIQDPMLAQVKAKVEASVPKELKNSFDAIVVAGLNLMFSTQTHKYMKKFLKAIQIAGREKAPTLVAHGIIKMLSIIHKEAGKNFSIPAAHPAALVLMAYALEFIEKTQDIEIDAGTIDEVAQLITGGYFKLFKIDKGQIEQSILKGKPEENGAEQPPDIQDMPRPEQREEVPVGRPPAPTGGGLMAGGSEGRRPNG